MKSSSRIYLHWRRGGGPNRPGELAQIKHTSFRGGGDTGGGLEAFVFCQVCDAITVIVFVLTSRVCIRTGYVKGGS
eukprot:scaffold101893_cov36-Prasinocladus_malaysianus.AAC.1